MNGDIEAVVRRICSGERLSAEDGLLLYSAAPLARLGELATLVRERFHGSRTYFNRNFHLEPTNLCIYDCKFCSYSRALKDRSEESWIYSLDEILERVKRYDEVPVTEVHIVGGVHPKLDIDFFSEVLLRIKKHRPELHIKAFTAVEIHYLCKRARVSYAAGLSRLKSAGLDSMPGGGAEIFHSEIRSKICEDKCTAEEWLEIHETAHRLGIPSNGTMLYGHLESYAHRIDHLCRLRSLQDKTLGFNTFIPLKFRRANNQLSHLAEVSEEDDLRNYAVSRLMVDNIAHIKAYWPMIGRKTAQRALSFGVDDLDGTIDDTTKIYSMAGSEEQRPAMTTDELVQMISETGRSAVERDTLYNPIRVYL